jgi:Uma2 family endonuclease
MVAAPEHYPKLTPEEYFVWEEQQNLRHEYLDGETYAMTGGSIKHSAIATKLARLIGNHLEGKNCQVLNSDARVQIHESDDYVYPDISVTCDQRDFTTTQYISHPCLIIEVLSPGTEAYDRNNKFKLYRRSPSLQEYVLVNTEQIEVEIFRKNDRNRWEILNFEAGDVVELESVNFTFPIEQLYQGIIFTDRAET